MRIICRERQAICGVMLKLWLKPTCDVELRTPLVRATLDVEISRILNVTISQFHDVYANTKR